MKLLWEEIDSQNFEHEILSEASGKQHYYIKGPFAVAEQENKNKRKYPFPILEREVLKFINEKIEKRQAGGELNHPQSPEVNPERISHYITELKRDGNVFIGKARISSAPMGKVVQSLLDDGYQLGVSTRGLGTVNSKGYVNEDYRMITVDIVGNPSGPGCYVDPIMENKEWIIRDDGKIVEGTAQAYRNLEAKLTTMPKYDVENYLNRAIKTFLSEIAGRK